MSDALVGNGGVKESNDEDGGEFRSDAHGSGNPTGNSVRPKKLILHIDLNNTILVSDAVTKQGTVAALDYFLSTVTWGHMSKGKWFDYTGRSAWLIDYQLDLFHSVRMFKLKLHC